MKAVIFLACANAMRVAVRAPPPTMVRATPPTMSASIDRRSALASAAAASLALHAPMSASAGPAGAGPEGAGSVWAGVKAELKALIASDENLGPTMVRLAWHSSGTYDKMSQTGGSGKGTIRFKEELAHGGNAGLDKMVAKLEPVHSKYPSVSYADLYTLAGVVAVEVAGGPSVGWRAGRVDSMNPADVTPDGRLPNADKGAPSATLSHLRKDVFYRMGFNDREIVALSGAHALGRCHPDASGYDGPWTPTPTRLNNGYFALLLNLPWTIKQWDGPMQFEDPSGKLMMLPSDIALIQDKTFRKIVVEYSKDQAAFFKDFAAAFQKLEELGTKNLKAVQV